MPALTVHCMLGKVGALSLARGAPQCLLSGFSCPLSQCCLHSVPFPTLPGCCARPRPSCIPVLTWFSVLFLLINPMLAWQAHRCHLHIYCSLVMPWGHHCFLIPMLDWEHLEGGLGPFLSVAADVGALLVPRCSLNDCGSALRPQATPPGPEGLACFKGALLPLKLE